MRNSIVFLALFIIVAVYLPWFQITASLSSGDWPYLYKENIESFRVITQGPFIWLEPYYQLTAKFGSQFLSLPWEVTEKLFWFYPFLFICIFSSWVFTSYVFGKLGIDRFKKYFVFLAVLIFSTNTYILMIVGGGQMGVGMAYALSPLVFFAFLKILDKKSFRLKDYLIFVLPPALQLMFDPRIFLLTIVAVFLYVISLALLRIKITNPSKMFLVLSVAFLLNLFWILPNSGFFQEQYSKASSEADASFLSFATFSNSISLLHPNWPENIFGKIGFMKPEFLVLSLLAYSSLLFISNIKNQRSKIHIKYQKSEGNSAVQQSSNGLIVFFVLLSLVGAFLAKGVNDPFGEVYLWLSSLPLGAVFRDPTKWYTLVAISYSVLIPFSVYKIHNSIRLRSKFQISNFKFQINLGDLFLLFTICYLIFLLRPAFLGQLSGTFSPGKVPQEYILFKKFLVNEKQFSNVLWLSTRQRFGFYSMQHPTLETREIIQAKTVQELVGKFKKEEARGILRKHNVGYVVVPYDSLGEIFLMDREYDESLYQKVVSELRSISWLEEVEGNFGKIVVFELINK